MVKKKKKRPSVRIRVRKRGSAARFAFLERPLNSLIHQRSSIAKKRKRCPPWLGILRNRRSSTVKVDEVNAVRAKTGDSHVPRMNESRKSLASYSTVVLARNPEFNASLMSLPFSFGATTIDSAAIVANSPPFSPTHPSPYDLSWSIDESTDQKLSIRVEFIVWPMIVYDRPADPLRHTKITSTRELLFLFPLLLLYFLRRPLLDRESRVLVGETASNNFPLIIIVREGGANLCASTRTSCVQVENQPASTIACII